MEKDKGMEQTILLIDDDALTLRIARKMFEGIYRMDAVQSGEEALSYLNGHMPDLILLDLHMPGMDGHRVMQILKGKDGIKDIPVIFLTADDEAESEVQGFQEGAMDFIKKPFVKEVAMQRIQRILELDHLRKHLQSEVEAQTKKIEMMSLQTVRALANAIDAKDSYTIGHSERVSEYAALLAAEMGWNEKGVDNLRFKALLHDVGKIGVPDSILNKPTRLSDMEYDVIKTHSGIGADILSTVTVIPGADQVAKYHHERYDGKGYPDGLSGEEIPLEARIVGIADAYDAMSSDRCYRKKLTGEEMRQQFVQGRGTQFDPEILDVFLHMYDENRLEISDKETAKDESSLGYVNASAKIVERVVQTLNMQKNAENIDFITGMDLRNSGERKIAVAMAEGEGCLAFFDVDNLKKVNDTMGHKFGDRVLRRMGEILLGSGENAVSCRLGGDEFLYFMKNVNREQAEKQIRQIMEDFRHEKEEDAVMRQVSLSAGLCMCTPQDTFADVYVRTDKALYHVKQNGKADYCFYHSKKLDRDNTDVDLSLLVRNLKSSGSYDGAMDMEYREFAKLFEYAENMQKRYQRGFCLVMTTLRISEKDDYYLEQMEEAMHHMEQAIRQTVRTVDVFTRYSSVQFLILLTEVGEENVKTVVDRIFANFYAKLGDIKAQASYSVAKLDMP